MRKMISEVASVATLVLFILNFYGKDYYNIYCKKSVERRSGI